MKREDEQRPNNTTKSIVINGKGLVLFVVLSLSAMVFLSYFPLATTSSSSSVFDKNAEEDGLLLPIAKEELEEVLKEEQREKNV
ncbi:hypothetical protein PQY76_00395 [bacterium]|nr:hypothetical protein [bacterium]MDC6465849.1 hypothetical protein [bacterium]